MQHEPFHYKSAEELTQDIREKNLSIPFSENWEVLAKPLQFGQAVFPNRLLAQPIEGFDAEPDGSPSQRSIRRYCDLASGGSGAVWIESVSVNHEGRSNPMQLWLTKENWESYRQMCRQIRQAAPGPIYLVLQLTHSGRNSNPDGTPTPVCGFRSPAIPKPNERIIPDEALEKLEDDYADVACLAADAGFDAVDIRACHGYLINEMFAAVNRPGIYGGSFVNRTRLLMNIIDKVRRRTDITVGVRLNMYDGVPYPYGWGVSARNPTQMDLTEPLELVRLLYAKGVRLLNISNGIGAYSPFVIRPYDRGGPHPTEHPLEGIARMQLCAKLVKEAAPDAVVIASGFSWLRSYAPAVAAGGVEAGWYDIAGFGRQSIADPGYAANILENGSLDHSRLCATCCGCTNLIKKSGKMLRCILKDKE